MAVLILLLFNYLFKHHILIIIHSHSISITLNSFHFISFLFSFFKQTKHNEGNNPPPGAERGDVFKGGLFPAVSPPNPGAGGGNRAPIPAFCGKPGPAGILGNGLGPGTAGL